MRTAVLPLLVVPLTYISAAFLRFGTRTLGEQIKTAHDYDVSQNEPGIVSDLFSRILRSHTTIQTGRTTLRISGLVQYFYKHIGTTLGR